MKNEVNTKEWGTMMWSALNQLSVNQHKNHRMAMIIDRWGFLSGMKWQIPNKE